MTGGDLPLLVTAAEQHCAVQANCFDRRSRSLNIKLLQAVGPAIERAKGGKPLRQSSGRWTIGRLCGKQNGFGFGTGVRIAMKFLQQAALRGRPRSRVDKLEARIADDESRRHREAFQTIRNGERDVLAVGGDFQQRPGEIDVRRIDGCPQPRAARRAGQGERTAGMAKLSMLARIVKCNFEHDGNPNERPAAGFISIQENRLWKQAGWESQGAGTYLRRHADAWGFASKSQETPDPRKALLAAVFWTGRGVF
jgi:hypothetical protein